MPVSQTRNRRVRNNGQQQGGWRVIRRTATEILDDETFHHFADAWAYAQPDPETGIHHYINRAEVLEEFNRGVRYMTTAYEGNVRIDLIRGSRAADPPTSSRIVT